MDPFKGIFDLVPILQRLDKMKVPVRLTIVGGRHELLARRFRQKKLDQLVTWTGRVPHEECYRLAAESDVLLMTSRKEPFGMVTIEAMSMGCVPIAYDTPSGSTEIIEDGQSGLLVPLGDFRFWAQAVKMLHEDREQLRRLSEGAMGRARTSFNEMTLASNLHVFLQRVQINARNHPWCARPDCRLKTYHKPARKNSAINGCRRQFANGCATGWAPARDFPTGCLTTGTNEMTNQSGKRESEVRSQKSEDGKWGQK